MYSVAFFASKIRSFRGINSIASSFKVILGRTYSTMEALVELEPSPEESFVASKERTRYNGRIKKRSWEEGGTGSGKKLKEGETFVRIKKKKVAVLLGYSGVNYFGMQRNPAVHTIEEDLLSAFLKAEYIDKEGFDCMQQIDFQRAARTDKGVSAVRQIVSVKLPLEAVPEKINEHLPECIRVFGMKRVTKGFNSKTNCDARTYSYTLPSFAFELSISTEEEQKAYRIPQTKIDEVNEVLSVYKNAKNYHNFTTKKSFTDPSCVRYMMWFKVDNVFVQSDMEFVLLKVKGQSFMLHQIRKMVGLALAVLRGLTSKDILQKAFLEERVRLPTAPGLGLLLEQVHYDRYDARYGKDGVHAALDWEELNDIIEKFKMEHIIPNTVKTEITENSMSIWLEELKRHNFVRNDNQKDDELQDDDESNFVDGANESLNDK